MDHLGRTWVPDPPAGQPTPQPTKQRASPKASYGPLPNPPALTDDALTVDDAWLLFGIPKKRGARDDVKRRYLAFVAKNHPDKHPDDEVRATAHLARANAAWALLQKHCRW